MVLSSLSLALSSTSNLVMRLMAGSHPNALMTASPNVKHEKVGTTDVILFLSPDANCAACSPLVGKAARNEPLKVQEPRLVLCHR